MNQPPTTGSQAYASHNDPGANNYGHGNNGAVGGAGPGQHDAPLGGTGERGQGSNMAMNMVMGKLTGNKQSHGGGYNVSPVAGLSMRTS